MKKNNQPTIKEQFVAVANVLRTDGHEDLATFIDGRVALLEKRSSAERKPKNTEANKALDEMILSVLKGKDNPISATAIYKEVGETPIEGIETLSLPRITNRLTTLKNAGVIERVQDKKNVGFRII